MARLRTPNIQVFDYGAAAQTGQNIQSTRLRNQMAGLGLEEKQNIIANRKKAAEIRAAMEGMPAQIAEMERRGMFQEADKLRNSYLDTRIQAIQMMEGTREGIDKTNYKKFRSDLIQAGAVDPSTMPVEYSDDWFRDKLNKEKVQFQTHTRRWASQGVVMQQDLVTEDGNVTWEGTPFKAGQGKGRGGTPWRMSSGDSGQIRKSAAAIFGSIWDPITQKYRGLNKEQELQVAAMAEEASRIFKANDGHLPHYQAVARAARKMDIKIRNLETDPQNQNPLNFPNYRPPATR